MKVRVTVRAMDLASLSEAAIAAYFQPKIMAALADRIGPHFVDAAKGRAPVGKGDRVDFQRVNLKPDAPGGGGSTSPAAEQEIFRMHAILAERGRGGIRKLLVRAGGQSTAPDFLSLFRGTKKRHTLERSPDIIKVQGRTFVGGFTHRAGNLRDSIEVDSIEATGQGVRMVVRAHAPYARAVHEGYNHRGGTTKKGKVTKIKGRPFLRQALVNVHEELTNPQTYTG